MNPSTDILQEKNIEIFDKNNTRIKLGDIISHNNHRYVIWHTVNWGVVAIAENTFKITDTHLMTDHRWRDIKWIRNVKKYIQIVDSVTFSS